MIGIHSARAAEGHPCPHWPSLVVRDSGLILSHCHRERPQGARRSYSCREPSHTEITMSAHGLLVMTQFLSPRTPRLRVKRCACRCHHSSRFTLHLFAFDFRQSSILQAHETGAITRSSVISIEKDIDFSIPVSHDIETVVTGLPLWQKSRDFRSAQFLRGAIKELFPGECGGYPEGYFREDTLCRQEPRSGMGELSWMLMRALFWRLIRSRRIFILLRSRRIPRSLYRPRL